MVPVKWSWLTIYNKERISAGVYLVLSEDDLLKGVW